MKRTSLAVIAALGFDPEDLVTLFDEPELPVSRWGTVKIDWRTMMTALPGVFAAGGFLGPASSVVVSAASAPFRRHHARLGLDLDFGVDLEVALRDNQFAFIQAVQNEIVAACARP